jgi:microcystin-dependent protein
LASSANTSFYLQGNANFNAGLNNKIITYARPKDTQTGAVGAVVNENLNNFLVIPGTIIAFGRSGFTPNGYLWCDGASVSKNAYPDLFAAIQYVWGGSGDFFNVPNLLGLFLRGYGASANPNVKTSSGGTPNGGNVGSVSTDSFGAHNHVLKLNTLGYGGVAFGGQREALSPATGQMNSQGRPNNGTLDVNYGYDPGLPAIQNSGTTENKPVSASVAYFIKY